MIPAHSPAIKYFILFIFKKNYLQASKNKNMAAFYGERFKAHSPDLKLSRLSHCRRSRGSWFQEQDQDSLLLKRRNDNHSPGPVIRELVPTLFARSFRRRFSRITTL